MNNPFARPLPWRWYDVLLFFSMKEASSSSTMRLHSRREVSAKLHVGIASGPCLPPGMRLMHRRPSRDVGDNLLGNGSSATGVAQLRTRKYVDHNRLIVRRRGHPAGLE